MLSLICLLWQLHSALSTREQDLKVYLNQIFKSEADFLKEQLERLRSWTTVLESVKQRAESTIQTSSDELHICILNAKSELENAIDSKPERGQRDQRSEAALRIVCDRWSVLSTLHSDCERVLQQVFDLFEDKSETI